MDTGTQLTGSQKYGNTENHGSVSAAKLLAFTDAKTPKPGSIFRVIAAALTLDEPDFCGKTSGWQASRKSHHTPDPQRGSTTY
jgi:hypothetical protein